MNAATKKAGREALVVRAPDPEEGGRQSNAKFCQSVRQVMVGKEAERWRELIPSRALRASVQSPKMGAVRNAKGTLCKLAKGWADLGEGTQTVMLRCPCRQGPPPSYQDAVHMMDECKDTAAVRDKVMQDMGTSVEKVGSNQDKAVWSQFSKEEKLGYSLNSAKAFSKGVDSRVKSAGASAWAQGIWEVDEELGGKHAVMGGLVEQVEIEHLALGLGKAVEHSSAGAGEGVGQWFGAGRDPAAL